MRCRTAQNLIGSNLEHPLSETELSALCAHLAHCSECRSFQARTRATLNAISDHAEQLRTAKPTLHFSTSLHARLAFEAETRRARPVARIEEILCRYASTRRAVLAACSFALQPLLVVLLAALALLGSSVTQTEPTPASRLTSLSIHASDRGQPCAQLTQRSAPPRAISVRALP